MKRLPSASSIRAPEARRTKRGTPPTAPKGRTGLSTPPGRTAEARAKSCRERTGFFTTSGASQPRGSQRPGGLARVVGDDHVRAGPADGRERLEHHARLV